MLIVPMAGIIGLFFVAPAVQAEPLTCNMQTFSGEDDVAHQMSLPFSLFLGGTDYNQVFLTTNATMTFGAPDANYWSYPSTPSVSLAGWDWVTWGDGAYVSYGYNSNSFCIEWSVRPFPTSTGDLTQIRLMVNRFNNGDWHGEITTFGWLPDNLRRGIVSTQNGEPLIIAAAFDVIRGVPIEVEPAPQPTSFDAPPQVNCWDGSQAASMDLCPVEPVVTCWDGSVVHYESECPIQPSPTPTPEPSSSETSTPEPTPSVEPTPTVTPSEPPLEPTPEPSETSVESSTSPSPSLPSSPSESQSQPVKPDLTPSPTPEPQTSSPEQEVPTQVENLALDQDVIAIPLPSDNNTTEEAFVILENGVVLEAEVAEALEVFDNIDLFLAAALTDPGKILTAFANVGADMTPEKRKEAQTITISVIIYAQLMNGLSAANMLLRRS